ncbi:MAG TPA: NUDIX hydrolase [Nocardioidaceae bacterium]|nr:NUDIX hydrolase [Nocardioidaceae bacterium]
MTGSPALGDGVVALSPRTASRGEHVFDVAIGEQVLGTVTLTEDAGARGRLDWSLTSAAVAQGLAPRALGLVVEHGFGLGLHRIEALVDARDVGAVTAATRAGLRREGVLRGHAAVDGASPTLQPASRPGGEREDRVVLARLSTDPPAGDPRGFRSLLNSSLPRKRAIAQVLVRDHERRVLLCRLTYKDDWDLPGGVVEVNESPQEAAAREVEEELGLVIPPGPLVLTDWLPPWSGWDDAICLVFDGGEHDPSLLDDAVLQAREIRSVAFCTPEQVRERAADFTARRIESALASLAGPGGPSYTESGRP